MTHEGPVKKVRTTIHCEGCKYLETKWWKDYLDNDETDSGTAAYCTKVPNEQYPNQPGTCITVYYSPSNNPPTWCPFLQKPVKPELYEVSKDEILAAKLVATAYGWQFKYANRKGKQYITLICNEEVRGRPDREFMYKFFPKAHNTSGGYGRGFNTTYRINPEETK